MDDFKKVTLRTLQACIEMIEIRNHNEYAKNASLQGVKVDFKSVKRKFKELSKDQINMMAQVTKRAAERNVKARSEKARKKNVK